MHGSASNRRTVKAPGCARPSWEGSKRAQSRQHRGPKSCGAKSQHPPLQAAQHARMRRISAITVVVRCRACAGWRLGGCSAGCASFVAICTSFVAICKSFVRQLYACMVCTQEPRPEAGTPGRVLCSPALWSRDRSVTPAPPPVTGPPPRLHPHPHPRPHPVSACAAARL